MLLEEIVRGHRQLVSYARDRTDGVGARAEVRDAPEELQCVAFLLQGESRGVGSAHHSDRVRGNLHGLLAALRFHHCAVDDDGGAGGDVSVCKERGAVRSGCHHSLDAREGRAVVHLDEGKVLLRTHRAHPPAQLHLVTHARHAGILTLDRSDALVPLERNGSGSGGGGLIRSGGDRARGHHHRPARVRRHRSGRRLAQRRTQRGRGGRALGGRERARGRGGGRGLPPQAARAAAHHS
mmetsp:Transcript_32330/g.81370  ORF Transcript_32330/g.81370 Transcript_32330/m.81370 type:complete len:238 (-) Transcript_32330:101-814(-)